MRMSQPAQLLATAAAAGCTLANVWAEVPVRPPAGGAEATEALSSGVARPDWRTTFSPLTRLARRSQLLVAVLTESSTAMEAEVCALAFRAAVAAIVADNSRISTAITCKCQHFKSERATILKLPGQHPAATGFRGAGSADIPPLTCLVVVPWFLFLLVVDHPILFHSLDHKS